MRSATSFSRCISIMSHPTWNMQIITIFSDSNWLYRFELCTLGSLSWFSFFTFLSVSQTRND
jgi:hypothetical protein